MILSVFLNQMIGKSKHSEFWIPNNLEKQFLLLVIWENKQLSELQVMWRSWQTGKVRVTCHRSWSQTLAVVLCSFVSLVNSLPVTSFAQYVYSDSSSCFCEQHGKGTVKWRALTNFLAGTEEPVRIYQIGEKEPYYYIVHVFCFQSYAIIKILIICKEH